jgi:hypothetical protein
MIIVLEFVEYNDYQINIGRHKLASSPIITKLRSSSPPFS